MQGHRGPQAGHSFELVATLSMCASPTRGGLAAQGRRYFSLEMFPCWKNGVFIGAFPTPVCVEGGGCARGTLAPVSWLINGTHAWPSRLLGG